MSFHPETHAVRQAEGKRHVVLCTSQNETRLRPSLMLYGPVRSVNVVPKPWEGKKGWGSDSYWWWTNRDRPDLPSTTNISPSKKGGLLKAKLFANVSPATSNRSLSFSLPLHFCFGSYLLARAWIFQFSYRDP